MIDLALRGGGPDNITCIVADVVDIDFGEDAPIMGGSMGDGSEDAPPPDSAAARASATTLTRTAPNRVAAPAAAPARPEPRLGLKLAVALLAVLAVLVGGAALTRIWVLQQYFVGVDAEHVVIFQGVRGSVLGVPLHRVTERSDIAVTDLPETERSQVNEGINASDGLEDARRLVERLRGLMLEPCPPPAPPRPARPGVAGAGPRRPRIRPPGRTRPWCRRVPRSTRPCHPRWTPHPCPRCRPSRGRPAGRWADGRPRPAQRRPPPASPAAARPSPAAPPRCPPGGASSWCCWPSPRCW